MSSISCVDFNLLHDEFVALRLATEEILDETRCLTSLVAQRVSFPSPKFLVLGDGNLTFSRSLCSRLSPQSCFIATVLESRSEFLSRYGDIGEQALTFLENAGSHVTVNFETDATRLPAHWIREFDCIVMNFPHPGGKTNLRRSRELLLHVFSSVRNVLAEDGFFLLSLANGQSGVDSECSAENMWIENRPKHSRDSWQLLYLAAAEGLIIESVTGFPHHLFREYSSSGYRSSKKSFDNRTSPQMFVLRVAGQEQPTFDELKKAEESKPLKFHVLRPYYVHDVSFLFKKPSEIDHWEAIVFRLLRELAGCMILNIVEVVELRSFCPDPCLPNRIYRLTWQTYSFPLSRSLSNEMQDELRRRIEFAIVERDLSLILT